jgi:hypothetical protein
MRVRLSVAGMLALGLLGMGLLHYTPTSASDESPENDTLPTTDGIAVVELFTSEGCSSCPPADRLLRTMVTEARSSDRPVYGLSFHVDYWNDLGWKDPYSKEAFTQRQHRYAEALGDRVYTPQMVVNGTNAFVGSKRSKARSAIEAALSKAEPVELQVQLTSDAAQSPAVRTTVPDPPANAVVHAALVERELSQSVRSGENAGRTLRHANVVRAFKSAPAETIRSFEFDAPSDVDPGEASIIVYVQDQTSLRILGAARVDLRASS